VQPDVSVSQADQPRDRCLDGSPAIAIEVVRSRYLGEALATKPELYFEFGAREVWLVYPKTQHILVWLGKSGRVIAKSNVVTTPLLPGFELVVRHWFRAATARKRNSTI